MLKKKIAFLALAIMTVSAGVVSAATAWGKYKGYDVIRLTVNGNVIKATDTPAISMSNRTMVPIYMLKEAGVNYSWDAANNTVAIQKNMQNDENGDTQLKAYFLAADFYKQLSDLGKSLNDMDDRVRSVYLRTQVIGISNTDGISELTSKYTDEYKEQSDYINTIGPKLISYGISIEKVQEILDYYGEAIQYYKESIANLEKDLKSFATGSKPTSSYTSPLFFGVNRSQSGQQLALNEYAKYKELILAE
ncbi:stalk domain-containing protein [Paenibacillus glycanilyticus]|uniref:stalk domain-containing protein n=1 Tax=Paenibacillus glycanilyticus TaxID=126569 RepID=UPI003EBE3777